MKYDRKRDVLEGVALFTLTLSGVRGIDYVAGENAPLVFFSGFTRSFLAGEQGTSAQWLQKILGKEIIRPRLTNRIEDKIAEMSAQRRVAPWIV